MMTDMEGKEIKFATNGVKVTRWFKDKMYVYWRHGAMTLTDPALFSTTIRHDMLQHGVEARLGDKCAIKVEEIPDVLERSREAQRRMEEVRDWYYTGTDQWDLPRSGGAGRGPGKDDLAEIVDRVAPGKGQVVVQALMRKHAEDLAEVRKEVLSKRDFAVAWVKIQAERAETRTQNLDVGNIDDFVSGLVGE